MYCLFLWQGVYDGFVGGGGFHKLPYSTGAIETAYRNI